MVPPVLGLLANIQRRGILHKYGDRRSAASDVARFPAHDHLDDADGRSRWGWGVAFLLLAVGPVLGIGQMLRLKRVRKQME